MGNQGKGDLTAGTPFSPAPTNEQGTRPRRIVKAALPSPPQKDVSVDKDESQDQELSSKASNKKHIVPKAIAESPSVARELEMEHQEENRKERMQIMSERQKAKREKLYQERRAGKKTTADDVQPNPFSRFLSVFSVEPAHPEHKRAYEGSDDEDEPEEKRLRASDEERQRESSASNWKSGTAAAILVAVVAVGVAAAFRAMRRS